MGLDMYMFKSKKTSHSVKELCELSNAEKEDSIFTDIAYWRKFNALHDWFVTHVQIGIDDCNIYEVTKDNITDLVDTLNSVLEKKDSTDFMPSIGFFFGNTEVDEYYWERVEDTHVKMYQLLNEFDWEDQRMFYQSSW